MGAFVLTRFIEPEFFPVVIAIPYEWIWLFPVAGAAATVVVTSRFDPDNFGPFNGLVAGALSYILFCAIHGAMATVSSINTYGDISALGIGPAIFLADLMFGTILVGWGAPVVGLLAGAIYKRRYGAAT
ncbi:MAG: hypothetical protein RIC85_01290 [Gammaproteobacteria bacterium]